MNLQAIFVANFTGFVLIVMMLAGQFLTRTRRRMEDRVFTFMMYLTMVSCLVEALTFYVDGRAGALNYWLNLLGNTYLYASNALGAFLFCIYVDRNLYRSMGRIRRIYNPLALVVVAIEISLIINLWGHFYFYVDADNVYHRQPLVSLFYIYIVMCAAFCITVYNVHRKKVGRTEFFPIYTYLVPIVAGSLLQMLFYGVSLAWLGTAIGLAALYISIQNRHSYVDMLTGLFNRLYLEHRYYEMQKNSSSSYYGIMMDINFFKKINDSYGHSAGDQALRDTARILKNLSDSRTEAFRYAGDEFIIILKTENEEDVVSVEKEIRQKADEFNRSAESPYKLSFALGHDKFDAGNDSEDDFLKKIDERMYEDKERIHLQADQ